MSRPATARLVLWDIDKTLVDLGGVSRHIYAAAFEAVTGFALRQLPNMAGKTDHDLILTSLAVHGVPEPEKYLDEFYSALFAATRARRAEIESLGHRLPGAYEAISRLAAVPGLVQSVVTGNIRPVAHLKLAAFDLAGAIDFDIGGYGSDDSDRAHLVRLALERARRKHAVDWPPARVFVIGDTPHDVAGAKANGVRAIGVATGRSTAGELALAGADAVLESLLDTEELLRLLR
jgi:phosphoglycolate phosphatase-like HAD superfamily hydrolase